MFRKHMKDAPAEELPAGREQSPAERIGQALLDSIGITDADDAAALAEAMLNEWSKPAERRRAPAAGRRAEMPEPGEAENLFDVKAKRPVPMRTGTAQAAPLDYAEMSPKQFSELKKKLRRAAMNGERIKI